MRVLVCLASQVNKIPSRALLAPLRCNAIQVRCISQVSNSGGGGGAGRKVPVKFTKSHQLDPTGLADLRYALARDHLKQYTEGDKRKELLDLALADNKAARNMKLDTKYFLQLLEILCAAEQWQQLIDEVDANIFTFGNSSTLLEYRAYAYVRLRNYKKALEDTDFILSHARSEERVMDAEELYMQKADCQIELGEYEAAFKTIKYCLKKGIVLDKALQVVVEKLDNVVEALELLNTEIAKHKEPSAEMLLCRASFHVLLGNPELALADYNLAPESERKRDYFVEYGNILGKLGRFEEEINILQSAQQRNAAQSQDLREYILQKQFLLFQFRTAAATAQAIPQDALRYPATRFLAESLLFTGDYAGALKFFTQALEEKHKKTQEENENEEEEEEDELSESDSFVLSGKQRCYFLRAVCNVALGHPDAALEDLETLTHPILAKKTLENLLVAKSTTKKLTNEDYEALQAAGIEYNIAVYKKVNKKHDEAEIHFTNALKCNVFNFFPFHVLKFNILLSRATNYEPLRRFTEVLEDCESALQILTCDSKQILSLQQSCLSTVERYEDIAEILKKYHLLNDSRDTEGPHLALALAYAGTRPIYQKAYEELQKCEHKSTHEWQKLLCTVTHELFKPEETIAAVNNFIQRRDISDEERGFALLLRAENIVRVLLRKDKYKHETKQHIDNAVQRILLDIQRSIELYPESKEDAVKLRAQVYFTFTTLYDEALSNYASLTDKMAANIGIAQCLKAIGKTEEATRHLETLLKGTETLSDDGGIMAFRGSVFYHLGQYEAAIENYSRGIVIRSNDDEFVANCYQQRAEAYIQLGDTKQAENNLKKAAELNPNRKEEYAQLELQFKKEENDTVQVSQQ